MEWMVWRRTLPVPDRESARHPGCERGSWGSAGADRISATAFQALLLHRSHDYAHALLNAAFKPD